MKQYRIGFSAAGLLAVLLVMLPNLVYFFAAPPVDYLAANNAGFWLFDVLENLGRFGVMLSLVFIVRRGAGRKSPPLTGIAAVSLLAYYVLWGFYFTGYATGLSLVGMAVLPTLFFLFVALAQKNLFAAFFALFFGIFHISITGSNFLFL